MIEFAVLPTAVQATLILTLVFTEAIILYFFYGILEELFAPTVLDLIEKSA